MFARQNAKESKEEDTRAQKEKIVSLRNQILWLMLMSPYDTKLFNNFKIYKAPRDLQREGNRKYHCMTFVCEFLDYKNAYLHNFDESIDNRIKFFLENSEKIKRSDLQVGDTITYKMKNDFMHIALYAGKINNTKYAISKFGVGFVFAHPIDSVPTIYGEPAFHRHFYKYNFALKPSVFVKFQTLSKNMADEENILSQDEIMPLQKVVHTEAADDYLNRLESVIGTDIIKREPKTHSTYFPKFWLKQLGEGAILELAKELDVTPNDIRP